MLFNSVTFVIFFVVVYSLYLLLAKRWRAQNLLLLVASYVFYGSWNWRFLLLLGASTVVDFLVVRAIEDSSEERKRKRLLTFIICTNVGVLGVFKYFNFFAGNAAAVLGVLGVHMSWVTLHIVLPVGISFYTFHEISYAVDVYQGRVRAARNLIEYGLFIAFFPLLVAGPIARASHLLPQIRRPRFIHADQVNAAIFLLLWGYFKKVVIADHAGVIADRVFDHYQHYQGLDLAIGVAAFTIQIYGDFSGYSDIARGLAKLMGFELGVNFRLPYFAVSPADFWRRWHISLSTWLRDYLYVPLGGNRGGRLKTYRNLAITMVLGGLWHGAAWNFVLWGCYQGALLVAFRLVEERRGTPNVATMSATSRAGRILGMLVLTMAGWLLFRARSAPQVWYMLMNMGVRSSSETAGLALVLGAVAVPLIVAEFYQHFRRDLLALWNVNVPSRVVLAGSLAAAILVFGLRTSIEFIYFQF
jgi:D-alanyl-lipoteichoic acid acyltransferase DltB (MBOAT superfamily)